MAKPNYSFEKRQRELAKKKKKEEKRLRKLDKDGTDEQGETEPGAETEAATETEQSPDPKTTLV